MSLPKYAEYKDSGVAWLGEVPAQWEIVPLKRIFRIVGGSTPKSENSEFWGGDIVWVSPADLSKLDSIKIGDSARKITNEGLASCGTTLVPPGSLVLSTRAPIGSLAIANVELCTNQGCKALVPKGASKSSFYAYMLLASTEQLNLRGKGTTFLELSADELGAFRIARPKEEEQSVIAAFLDRETGKIDALIAEQEKLLTLLAEKRQATISRAVTRGLNPNAPMKDSGVPWLGEVPEHWEVKRVSRCFKAKKGGNAAELTKEYCAAIEGDYPVFSGQTENDGVMGCINVYEFDAGEDGWILSTTVGAKAMSVRHLKGRFSLSQNCMVILPTRDDLVMRFFFYQLQPLFFYERRMIPDHMQPSFRMEDLYSYKIAVPPQDEQKAIAAFLDHESGKLDALKIEAELIVTLLKERRDALIATAVTGKIDVRGQPLAMEDSCS